MRHLRVVAYCRVSTEQKEQDSNIRLQKLDYTRLIDKNPNWENVRIFSEKVVELSIKERKAFQTMINSCKKGSIDLILKKSISHFGRNTLDMSKGLQEL